MISIIQNFINFSSSSEWLTLLQTSVEASTSPSYRDDCEAEGRSANYEFTISKLDDAAIKRWWVQFSDSSKYHLLGNNCCNVVFKALKEGGADKFVSIPWTFVATPDNLKDYSMKLQQATQ